MSAPFTVGDRGVTLGGKCADETGSVDLTGATVELHICPPVGDVLTRTAVIDSPGGGTWSYTWADGDLTVAGHWWVEAQVTNGGTIQTFGPVSFEVQPEIG